MSSSPASSPSNDEWHHVAPTPGVPAPPGHPHDHATAAPASTHPQPPSRSAATAAATPAATPSRSPWVLAPSIRDRCRQGDILLVCRGGRRVQCHWSALYGLSEPLNQALLQGSGLVGRPSFAVTTNRERWAEVVLGGSPAQPARVVMADDLKEHWVFALNWLYPSTGRPKPVPDARNAPGLALLQHKYKVPILAYEWKQFVKRVCVDDPRVAHVSFTIQGWSQLQHRSGSAATLTSDKFTAGEYDWAVRVLPMKPLLNGPSLRGGEDARSSSGTSSRPATGGTRTASSSGAGSAGGSSTGASGSGAGGACGVCLQVVRLLAGWDLLGSHGDAQAHFSIAVSRPASHVLDLTDAQHARLVVELPLGSPPPLQFQTGLHPALFKPGEAVGFALADGIPREYVSDTDTLVVNVLVQVPWPRFEGVRQQLCEGTAALVPAAKPALQRCILPVLSGLPGSAMYVFTWLDLAERVGDEELEEKCQEFVLQNLGYAYHEPQFLQDMMAKMAGPQGVRRESA